MIREDVLVSGRRAALLHCERIEQRKDNVDNIEKEEVSNQSKQQI